jgi:hypothetical protein
MDTDVETVEMAGEGALSPLRSPRAEPAQPLAYTETAVSLLDLPDELLSKIYADAYHPSRASARDQSVGISTPLLPLLVSKRILTITKPLFFQHLAVPSSPWAADQFFTGLQQHLPNFQLLIRSLNRVHLDNSPALHTNTVALLSTLRSFTLQLREVSVIPRNVSEALKKLRRLKDLSITGIADRFEDDKFSIIADLPSVRSFEGGVLCNTAFIVSGGQSSVKELTSRDMEMSSFAIPHTGLETLTFRPYAGYIPDGDSLVTRFDEAWEQMVSQCLAFLSYLFFRSPLYDCTDLSSSHSKHLFRSAA